MSKSVLGQFVQWTSTLLSRWTWDEENFVSVAVVAADAVVVAAALAWWV